MQILDRRHFVSSAALGFTGLTLPGCATTTAGPLIPVAATGCLPPVKVSEGRVIRTEPGKAVPTPKNSFVTIVVSDGVELVTVPELVNQTQATAEARLINAGLNPQVTFANSATVPSGVVISQSVAPGTSVASGSSVGIVVSQGPAPATTTTTAP